ncbi:family 43 glycosylhydrolase [Hephaestia sp. GCM10023244]|uniref:family 43 glycosylhydrolase n=1 Tax=unclassified Hephaestia TaxID=2631281 RepID=UPI0020777376|nr:family 43 glycosylhydrolase [Hephaestia sp. MAHUQ-44]MCM8731675.1 family 43 glycosylhydrolase [Hephaestia sp. MAHUQ-44]
MNRRDTLKGLVTAGGAMMIAPRVAAQGPAASASLDPYEDMRWGKGFEGQRRADLGNGTFLNPVFAGDHPDPSIVRDGDDYYITFSTFDAYPGIVIWHSRDLVNWRPVTAALTVPIGSVWAPELIKHDGRFYCYIPARTPERRSIYVIHADRIEGPWSAPVDLDLPDHIDPGHAVGADGRRWLFLSGGDRVPLTPDGLATAGPVEHVYDPWHYPEDWVVESFSPEGPKIMQRGDYYYLITAVGGTAGPPTGHMVIAARARSLDGPWEDDPANPLVRTESAAEKWWSRGHATVFEGPGGAWWTVYHGYENGYWTLGRQTLLAPVTWSDDGWPRFGGGDLSHALAKPIAGPVVPHGMPLSDDFSHDRFGPLWAFYDPAPDEKRRVTFGNRALRLAGKGSSPADCSPVSLIAGDQRYRISVEVVLDGGVEAGLLLFYSRRLYAGLGVDRDGLVMHRYGQRRRAGPSGTAAGPIRIRITNDRNIVTIETSLDGGRSWRRFGVQMEVSGYHHNVAGDFLSLRPALYAAGKGIATFRDFRYEALP